MKLSEYNKKGDEYTGKASEIVRQMLLGGIALIWVFKETENGNSKIDKLLLFPALTICFALLCDLLQYVVGGYKWKVFFRQKELEVKEALRSVNQPSDEQRNPDTKAPRSLNSWIYFFYWSKIILMLASYLLIIIYISNEINFQ